jgi:hypothetical protein
MEIDAHRGTSLELGKMVVQRREVDKALGTVVADLRGITEGKRRMKTSSRVASTASGASFGDGGEPLECGWHR